MDVQNFNLQNLAQLENWKGLICAHAMQEDSIQHLNWFLLKDVKANLTLINKTM